MRTCYSVNDDTYMLVRCALDFLQQHVHLKSVPIVFHRITHHFTETLYKPAVT